MYFKAVIYEDSHAPTHVNYIKELKLIKAESGIRLHRSQGEGGKGILDQGTIVQLSKMKKPQECEIQHGTYSPQYCEALLKMS